MNKTGSIFEFLQAIESPTLPGVVGALIQKYPNLKIAFSTSFSQEDQSITHQIATEKLPVRIFTLDTGRHFAETYKTLQATREKYGLDIEVFFPQTEAVQNLMHTKGAFSFYESLEARLECCHIRKVEPLARALSGVDVWITGIRQAHSSDRKSLPYFELDNTHGCVKYHPLLQWQDSTLQAYLHANAIPTNRLYTKGFLSIGCEPCTRPVAPGGDLRSGRWWWEDESKKECGLHVHSRVQPGAQQNGLNA